jgi:nucleotide-binding universal stress UspA family protein
VVGAEQGAGSERVVVGVDGSPGARAALVWAMSDAARRGARLRVVSTFPVELYWSDPLLLDSRSIDAVRADTEIKVRALVDEVAAESGAPRIEVEILALPGSAAQQVLAAAEDADLLVVGSRGRGPVRSTVLGSVALHVVTHAQCPVVVVHPRSDTAPANPRVVVGLDGSDASRGALARAVAEAAQRGAAVSAVAAYSGDSYWSDAYAVVIPPPEKLREDTQRGADAIVAEVAAGRPGVPIRAAAIEGPAGDVLVRAAEGAELLVVGARGHGVVRGMLLGSVALHCVIHAPCPVLVIPAGPTGAAAG